LTHKFTVVTNQVQKSLVERDAAVVWHPYTQHLHMRAPLPIVKGKGASLIDENGNQYIDAASSWWTSLHGHGHPFIAQKIYEQAMQLEHVIFAGCTHEPAVSLAEQLIELLPGNMSRIFYSDNGSTAVEVALKMAMQYWRNSGRESLPARKRILALKHSYHGDTFGAMSVSERGVFTLAFEEFLFNVRFLDPFHEDLSLKQQCTGLDLEEVAAFIYEPVLQGAGGMNIIDREALNDLLCHLKQHGVICIADEVMTGFGRTGLLFASDWLHHKPDIICLSKGLTGGTMALGATASTEKIFEAFLDEDPRLTFFHGHSFTANPLACAAAIASLHLLQQEECLAGIEYITQRNRNFVNQFSGHAGIRNLRSLGTILAFEMEREEKKYLSHIKEEVMRLAKAEGILLRPLGNTVYIMPPYCITAIQLEKVMAVLEKIIGMQPGADDQ